MKKAPLKPAKLLVQQQSSSDCGVACLLTVLRYFGGNQSLENLREISGTTAQGTTLLGLVQACPQLGLAGKGLRTELAYLYQITHPVILPVVIDERLNHYVVCFPSPQPQRGEKKPPTSEGSPLTPEGGIFIVGNPAKGIVTYTEAELAEIWKSQAVLEITPSPDFQTEKQNKKAKWRWFWELAMPETEMLVIASVIGVLLALLSMANAIFSQKLIDDILPKANYLKLYTGLVLLGILLLGRVGLGTLRSWFLLKQSYLFNQRLISKFYSSLLFLPKSFFDNRKIGDLTARMNDTRKIQSNISYLAGNVMIDVLTLFMSVIFIFSYDVWVGLLSLVSIPLYILLAYRFHKPLLSAQRNVMESYAKNESNYIDTIQGIATIKNLHKEALFTQTTHQIYQHFQDNLLRLGKTSLRFSVVGELIGVGLMIAVFGLVCRQVLYKELNIGEMTALLAMCGSLLPSVARLAMVNLQIQEAQIAFDRMYEFAALKPETFFPLQNGEGLGRGFKNLPAHAEPTVFEKLEVKDLSFRFAGRKQLFKNIGFSLERGKILALLGDSGAGKSTILQILQRFYMPESGFIFLNDKDWQIVDTAVWRTSVGIVPQEVKIFNSTLLENICFENLQQNAPKLIQLLQVLDLMSFFEQFPQGLLTIVGEQGQKLSGGQKQVVAFVRALFHEPKLLLLDEFTSAMDTSLAQKMLQKLMLFKPQMMTIFVTHQPELARLADEIVSL